MAALRLSRRTERLTAARRESSGDPPTGEEASELELKLIASLGGAAREAGADSISDIVGNVDIVDCCWCCSRCGFGSVY